MGLDARPLANGSARQFDIGAHRVGGVNGGGVGECAQKKICDARTRNASDGDTSIGIGRVSAERIASESAGTGDRVGEPARADGVFLPAVVFDRNADNGIYDVLAAGRQLVVARADTGGTDDEDAPNARFLHRVDDALCALRARGVVVSLGAAERDNDSVVTLEDGGEVIRDEDVGLHDVQARVRERHGARRSGERGDVMACLEGLLNQFETGSAGATDDGDFHAKVLSMVEHDIAVGAAFGAS